MSILPKSKPKFIQQYHKLPTLSKFQKPPTFSKLHHKKKLKNLKKKPILRMLQSQHFQTWSITQCPQNFKITKGKNLTMKLSIKHATTFFQAKRPKKKLTLVSTWQYGAWVLGSWRSPSSLFQSNVGSYFLPWEARKEDPLEEQAILMQRKWVLENGFHQKWVCDENAQNTRI